MPRRQRQGLCVYCEVTGPVTSDHVPPKCLFPPETRVNLMTVNACSACHDTFKLDDEYFRIVLSIRSDLPKNSNSSFLRSQTKKTLQSAEATGLRNSIRAAISLRPFCTDGGIYLGHAQALKVETVRIVRTSDRIIRGLFPKLLGSGLSKSYEASAVLFDLQKDDSAVLHPDVQESLKLLVSRGVHKKYGDVLDVYALHCEDDPQTSMWLVRLHKVFGFIGYTNPRDAVDVAPA
jgi:hypothetical protein